MRGTQYVITETTIVKAVLHAIENRTTLKLRSISNAPTVNSSVPIVTKSSIQRPEIQGRAYWKTNWNSGHGFQKTLYTPSSQILAVPPAWTPWD